MTNILVLDTATEACSVALQVGNKTYSLFEVCPQQHSQRILPMIDSVLGEAGISLNELDCLAYGRGPGSFTGVRIASGIIQGLAIGTDLPVVGVSTLAAMAQQAFLTEGALNISAAIDARMNEVYFAHYEVEDEIVLEQIPEKVEAPEKVNVGLTDLGLITAVGTGWNAYDTLSIGLDLAIKQDIAYPNALYMLPLAIRDFQRGMAVPVEESQPVYLRDKVTWKKLPGRE